MDAMYQNKLIVLHMIRKATEKHSDWVLGKKALQKSLYFFNLKQDCFRFKWADFGPMSGEILQIAHDLEAAGRIKTESVKMKRPNVFIRSMRYVSKDPDLEISPDLNHSLEETLDFVAERSSSELELLASVHFWATRCSDGDLAEYIHRKMEELKPEAGFTRKDVEGYILLLRKHRILQDVAAV